MGRKTSRDARIYFLFMVHKKALASESMENVRNQWGIRWGIACDSNAGLKTARKTTGLRNKECCENTSLSCARSTLDEHELRLWNEIEMLFKCVGEMVARLEEWQKSMWIIRHYWTFANNERHFLCLKMFIIKEKLIPRAFSFIWMKWLGKLL